MSGGFFWPDRSASSNATTAVGSRTLNCTTCKLYRTCHSPRMPVTGKGKKGIFILGEMPSAREDETGVQMAGPAGQRLRQMLRKVGVDLDNDCWKLNAVCCYPPKGRDLSNNEIAACRPRVFKALQELKPRLVLLLGNVAVQSAIGHRWKKELGGVSRWRGYMIPDRTLNTWLSATYHPSFLLQKDLQYGRETFNVAEVIAQRDIENAIERMNEPVPEMQNDVDCITLVAGDYANLMLEKMQQKQPKLVAFDYETTGLKPHKSGHDIICCSVCWQKDRAYVFPMDKVDINLFRGFLSDKNIGKIASNMKFEDSWTRQILGCRVKGWKWDTMLAAHVQDNRRQGTSIKFLTAVRFGVFDYDSDIGHFLKSGDEDNANSFNKIRQAPVQKLLTYCGLDSLYEYRMALLQRKEMLK